MVNSFIEKDILNKAENIQSINRMWNIGLRFDLKIISLFLAVPFIISSILLTTLSHQVILTGYSWYAIIISILFSLVLIGNYYYFKTYKTYYDVFIFGLIEEDTKAVLKSIFDDYPLFKISITSLILGLIPYYFIQSAAIIQYELSNWLNVLSFILTILVMFLMIRGTINSKPLGRIHAQVSSLAILNKMVPNGVLAIRWAFQDRKSNVTFAAVNPKEGEQLIKDALALNKDTLYAHTPKNEYLEKKKPNVILAIMESFGGNGLITDDPINNDLLASLRPYMESEFVFKRFLSSSNGTMSSLASIYFHSPVQEITQSIVQNTVIKTNPFLVYKEKGYKTVFISAGNLMWRNLANYLPIQGVDEIYDQNDLMDRYPESKKTFSYWGIADEFAFKLAEELLANANEPMFINILTITNHPPYQAPKTYEAKTVDPNVLEGRMGDNETERRNILESFQYACNALGNFINHIKSSNKANNTIIAATGDHHIRGMKQFFPKELFMAHSVPFILSIPEQIKSQFSIDYSPTKLGSHKDIFPTLYHFSLSDVKYWTCGGENLLAPVSPNYFAFHPAVWADDSGIVDLTTPELLKYQWDQNNNLMSSEQTLTNEKHSRIRAYQHLLNWQINYLLKGYEENGKA
ncbi:LTA synthase family protein [Actinobacillus equuli subsp. equuli]|uniref:LTA synthase family protein n=1 Tax=Actinobacillus equuli TaxID=718 RepID=UPI002442AD0F|nr:LTA synthase family protein [Actinobacillus equuli]WGE54513.1 LTA synthase family protein [Actinobacillus equuli subsp. equuli]